MDTEAANRKIFIGGLSYSTDDDKLRDYFEKFGPVQDAVVMKDPVTKRSRGFGFITFDASIYVDIALEQDVHIIDSRKVEAKRAVPRSEVSGSSKDVVSAAASSGASKSAPPPPVAASPVVVHTPAAPSTNHSNSTSHDNNTNRYNSEEYAYHKIFVGGLHYDTRDAEFRSYFEIYGRVLSAEVMFNRETHKSRGFGFIIFEKESSVDLVCEERDHIINGKMVEVKRAVPRSRIQPNGNSHAPPKSSASAPYPKTNSSKVGGAERSPRKTAPRTAPRTATSQAIACVGVRTKQSPKSTGSYAAALLIGSNSQEEDTLDLGSMSPVDPVISATRSDRSNSLTSISSADLLAAVANPDLTQMNYGSAQANLFSSQSSRGDSPASSLGGIPLTSPSGLGGSPSSHSHGVQQQPIGSPRATFMSSPISPTNREGLPPPNMGGIPPSMMLPQSVMPQGPVSHEQMHQSHLMRQYQYAQMHQAQQMHRLQMHDDAGLAGNSGDRVNGSGFDGFPIHRTDRSVSESFLPPKHPVYMTDARRYGGVPPVGYGGNFEQQQIAMAFHHHQQMRHQQYQGNTLLNPGEDPQMFQNLPDGAAKQMVGSDTNRPTAAWLPASLSASGVGPSQNSELDSAGEDAIGLGLAMSMDLTSAPPDQMEFSRFVGLNGAPISRSVSESYASVRHRPPPSADSMTIDNRNSQFNPAPYAWGNGSIMNSGFNELSPHRAAHGDVQLQQAGGMYTGASPGYHGHSGQSTLSGNEYQPQQFQELNSNSAEFNPSSRQWNMSNGR